MSRATILGLAIGLAAALSLPSPADADGKRGYYTSNGKYRKAPAVRGYYIVRNGGGYSYVAADVVNTYGDNRTRYGSTNYYRNQRVDRQSQFGPFDSGFFFDSAITPGGGYAPYQH